MNILVPFIDKGNENYSHYMDGKSETQEAINFPKTQNPVNDQAKNET